MADALLYHYRRGCVTCNGDGVMERQLLVGQEAHVPCPACEGTGWRWVYRAPTPADLLTDPRVRAVVTAARQVLGHTWESHELESALAPFEEVPRG